MSLENQTVGEIYKQTSNSVSTDSGVASMQLNDAVGGTSPATKPKKKVIYFADGSTMEDYDDDDDDDTKERNAVKADDSVEGTIRSVQAHSTQSEPPNDPSKMLWPEWIRFQTQRAGSKTLTALEGMGGTAAYYLGITTPKYQSEIDEYNRMVAKKKTQEEELVSWSTGPKPGQQELVVADVKKNESEDIEMTKK